MGSQTPSSSDPSSGKKNINRGRWTKEEVCIKMLSILTISRYQSEGLVAHAVKRDGEVCQSEEKQLTACKPLLACPGY